MIAKTKKVADLTVDELTVELKRLKEKVDRITKEYYATNDADERNRLLSILKPLNRRREDVQYTLNLKKNKKKKVSAFGKIKRTTQFDDVPTKPVPDPRGNKEPEPDDPNPAATLAKKLQEQSTPDWLKRMKDPTAKDEESAQVTESPSAKYLRDIIKDLKAKK